MYTQVLDKVKTIVKLGSKALDLVAPRCPKYISLEQKPNIVTIYNIGSTSQPCMLSRSDAWRAAEPKPITSNAK